jgi:hypothetical protein
MDNLFDELYNDIINEDESNEDKCNICHYKTVTDKLTLACNHIFHNKCLKKLIKCPYCNKIIYKEELKKNNLCKSILKSGKNKGKECEKFLCKVHTKNIDIPKKKYSHPTDSIKNNSNSICKTILKSGKNKGKECGRSNCKYHKNNSIII